MAIRFLVLFAPSPNTLAPALTSHLAEVVNLQVVIATPHLLVLSSSPGGLVLPGNGGAIVGHVFSSYGHGKIERADAINAERLRETHGDSLIREIWGGYVAIVADRSGERVDILRDPSGAMPCVWTRQPFGYALASDIETLFLAGLFKPDVNWSAVISHLLAYDFRTETTALQGVREVLPGQRLTLSSEKGDETTAVWSPWDFIAADANRSTEATADDLREIVINTVQTWASAFQSVLLGVSGGLDSSVLAAILKDGPTRLICYTMVTDQSEGDERVYTRALSESLALPVREHFYDLAHVDIGRVTAPHLPRPLRLAFGQSDHRAKLEIAACEKIDAFFTGIGGDNVFCNMVSARPITDRFLTAGPGIGVWRTLNDVCTLTGCSYRQALEKALACLPLERRRTAWLTTTRFLTPDLISTLPAKLDHPWLNGPVDAVPGKWSHVAMMARLQGTLDGFSRLTTPPLINPLISQPIVEACLRIPTWQWCAGGRNRAIVRNAFAGLLPPTILQRRSKGGPSGFAHAVIEANRETLLEKLLNGHASRAGILDTQEIERALRSHAPLQDLDYRRFGFLGELAAWTEHWANQAPPRQSAQARDSRSFSSANTASANYPPVGFRL